MSLRRRLMMMQTDLPGAYRKVEYLQQNSSKTAYITLNEYPTIDCEIGIDCYVVHNNGNEFFMGSRKPYNGGCSAIIGVQPNLVYQFGNMSSSQFNRAISLNQRHTIIANKIGCYLDGVSPSTAIYAYNGSAAVGTGGTKMMLFASAQGNDVAEFIAPAGFRVYSAYVKKNGIYTVKLIPCVRKSDSKPGMYDTVTKTFYTNAGTYDFIVPN